MKTQQEMHNHFFGFEGMKDLIQSISGSKFKALVILDLAGAFSIALASMVASIELWVWSPFYSLVIYFVVLVADFVSGVMVGVKKRNEGFLTQKAQRLPVILIGHLILLGVFYNLGKINHDLGIQGLNNVVFDGAARTAYFYVIGINLVSFIKNLVLLGALKGKAGEFLTKYVDTQKNLTNENN